MTALAGLARGVAGLLGLCLSACVAVGPNYGGPPAPPTAAPFGAADRDFVRAAEPPDLWWKQLGDPILDDLIARAVTANLDVRAAAANIAAAQAALDVAAAARTPTLDASASFSHERSSAATLRGTPNGRIPSANFSEGLLSLSWEADLFGRVRRSVEAARADAERSEELRRQVLTVVIANVASTYVDLRGAQRRLEVARRNAANQHDTFVLTETLSGAGRGTDLDIARARAQLETTTATIPPLETTIKSDRHQLALLLGLPPTALDQQLAQVSGLPRLPEFIPVGSPASLLRRRPDVAAAERALAAATARIGVARASLYPDITFSADIGSEANQPGYLGDRGALTFGVGPTISWSLFDPAIYARIRGAHATTDAAIADFQKTVLTALADTETALDAYAGERRRLGALVTADEASTRAAELAQIRYRYGAENFLTVLDAERTRLEADDARAQSEIQRAQDLIAIFRALGGGWTVAARS